MDNTLRPAGYQEAIVNGENVWCKGDGVMVIMRCFSVVFTAETALIQVWTREAIIGESAIYGGMHKIPKKEMSSLLEKIDKQIDDLNRESVNRQPYLTAAGNGSNIYQNAGNGSNIYQNAGNGPNIYQNAGNGPNIYQNAGNEPYIYQNAGNGTYICQNCGRPIPAGSRFCGWCGRGINFQPLPQTGSAGCSIVSGTPSAAKKAEKNRKKSGRKWIWIFLAFIAAVIVVAAIYVTLSILFRVESPRYEYDSEGNIIKQEIYDDDGSLSCYYIYTRDSSGNIEGYTKYLADGSVDFYTVYTYDQDYGNYHCSLYVEQFDADGTLEFVYLRDKNGNYDVAVGVSDNTYAYISGGWVLLEGFLEN